MTTQALHDTQQGARPSARRGRFIRPTLITAVLAALIALGTSAMAARTQAPEPGHSLAVATFRGAPAPSGKTVLGPVALEAGLVVVKARHGGRANFSLWLQLGGDLQTGEGLQETHLLINEAGRFNGGSAALLRAPGDWYLIVTADGPYEFVVEQPREGNVTPVRDRSFEGENQDVTPVFALPAGTYTLRLTSDADVGLWGWLYQVDDLGGAAVFTSDYDGRFFVSSGPGPYDAAVTLTLRRPGLFLAKVDAAALSSTRAPDTWTLTIE